MSKVKAITVGSPLSRERPLVRGEPNVIAMMEGEKRLEDADTRFAYDVVCSIQVVGVLSRGDMSHGTEHDDEILKREWD